jgi:hypothetical protein
MPLLTKRTKKQTTQAFATPMTGVEAIEAGRREYEAVAAETTGATPAAPRSHPPPRQSRCERNMTRPGPIFTPKRERAKGKVIDQQINNLRP